MEILMKTKTMKTSKNDIRQCLVWVQGLEEEEIGVMKTRIVKELELTVIGLTDRGLYEAFFDKF